MLSMTQLSWGVLHAVSDINIHNQRLAARDGSSWLPRGMVGREKEGKEAAAGRPNKRVRRKKMANTSTFNGCVQCGVGDSPRWRRGPAGPLTLCNMCGLLYAKKAQSVKSGRSAAS